MARLDKEQWAIIRKRWEDDAREGYSWIVEELSLSVTKEAVQMRAKREGWKKSFVSPIVSPLTKPEEPETEPTKLVGRPTKYKEDYNDQVFKLALLGLTDEQMADVIDVSRQVFDGWKVRYPEFHASIKRGKAPADAEVAVSLYDSARGYAHEDVHISDYQGQITVTPIIKRYPPNFQSASLWLRNRQPALWKKDVVIREISKDPFPEKSELNALRNKRLAEAKERNDRMRTERAELGIDIIGFLSGVTS